MRPRALLGRAWDGLPFKRVVLEPLRRLRVLPPRVYRHLHFNGVFRTKVLDSHVLLRSYGHEIENQVFWSGVFGDFEGWSVRLWTSLAKSASVVLDVGANTGVYAFVAQAVNPSATVYAFEPVVPIFRKLEENAVLNGGRVHCIAAAASDSTGTVTIHVPEGEHAYSSSLDPEVFGPGAGAGWEARTVEATRLDEFVQARGVVPDLVKIDVEGQEARVLEGMGDVLATRRPTLLLEILRMEAAEAVWSILRDLAYEGFEIDEEAGPRALAQDHEPTLGRNVLFCTAEVASGSELLRGR